MKTWAILLNCWHSLCYKDEVGKRVNYYKYVIFWECSGIMRTIIFWNWTLILKKDDTRKMMEWTSNWKHGQNLLILIIFIYEFYIHFLKLYSGTSIYRKWPKPLSRHDFNLYKLLKLLRPKIWLNILSGARFFLLKNDLCEWLTFL